MCKSRGPAPSESGAGVASLALGNDSRDFLIIFNRWEPLRIHVVPSLSGGSTGKPNSRALLASSVEASAYIAVSLLCPYMPL
jgi:hypothetical protein